jgi:hypothetical protein
VIADPIIPVTEQATVRTFKNRWERLTWLDLFCRGERGIANQAW